MRMLVLVGAAGLLAACGSAKSQAIEECDKQAEALPDMVDADKFCDCLVSEIPDDASVSEAEEVLIANTSKCTQEAMGDVMSELGAPPAAEEAPAE